jgi:hypothetical protein
MFNSLSLCCARNSDYFTKTSRLWLASEISFNSWRKLYVSGERNWDLKRLKDNRRLSV